ncbi:MAG: permease-like cell division protein FtsX [Desulfuromonadales bacterium]
MLERISYFIFRALRNMRQSPFLCLAAVGTVAVSLTILAFFGLLVLNVQKLTTHWSREVQVVAYFQSVPNEAELKDWMGEIRGFPEVEKVTFVSSREAFQRFSKRLAENADLLDGLASDILPASLEVALKQPYRNRKGIEAVVGRLKKNGNFSDFRYGQDWLERFESFLALVRTAGGILGGFLLFATLFIVANTIKLTIYARREELEIMSLVGGTPFSIQAPFLLEGILQGAFGGLLSLGASYALFALFLQEGLRTLLLAAGVGGITFLPPLYQLLLVAAGIFLGFSGSLISLRKFVRI